MGVFDEAARRLLTKTLRKTAPQSGRRDLGAQSPSAASAPQMTPEAFEAACRILIPNEADRATILGNFNKLSSDQYMINPDGELKLLGPAPDDGARRSRSYADQTKTIIDEPARTAIMEINPTFMRPPSPDATDSAPQEVSVDGERGGGVTIPAGRGQVRVVLSGNGYTFGKPDGGLYMSPEEIQMHEIMTHVGPVLVEAPPPRLTNEDLYTKSITEFENRVRQQELGLPPRPPEPEHGFLGILPVPRKP